LAPAATPGQKNAAGKAADYLDYGAFSRSGLIKQSKYEGFTTAQAMTVATTPEACRRAFLRLGADAAQAQETQGDARERSRTPHKTPHAKACCRPGAAANGSSARSANMCS
jgi:hypothetical protein